MNAKQQAAAQDQRLIDGGLEMPVLGFHRPILVGLTTVVAAGVHAVMADEGIIALGHVFALIDSQITESGREAVGAVVLRHAAQLVVRRATRGPGSQVLGQGREAFAAKNHADMLPPKVAFGGCRP